MDAAHGEGVRNSWLTHPPKTRRRTNHKLRKEVLADEPRCRLCGATENLEVDHIRPVCMGGTEDRANLQTICRRDHLSKSGREANHVRWVINRRHMDRGNGPGRCDGER